MGRDIDPKCRQCRRAGKKLFLKGERCFSAKCAMVKRNYPPGLHGQKRATKASEYSKQLAAKQAAKKIFRLRESQFRNYFNRADSQKGDTSKNLLTLLETRFDNVIFKLGLATSRDQARQLVSHGHFLINGKKVNIPSYELKIGNTISVNPKSIDNKIFASIIENIKSKDCPEWLAFDEKTKQSKIISNPEEKDFDSSIEPRLIVEFYSR